MKQLLFITLATLLLFSCKKEKLKDDYAILIGEWHQIKSTDHSGSGCTLETFDSNNPPKITFKKNGKVFVKKYATEKKFLMRLNEIDEYPPTRKAYFSCPQTIATIENYFIFIAELSRRFSSKKYEAFIYVNENKLIISSNSKDIISESPDEGELGGHFTHIFEKVN